MAARARRPKGDGHVARRPDRRGLWRGYLTQPDGRRLYVSGASAAEVAAKLQQERARLLRGEATPATQTVEALVRRWLEAKRDTQSRRTGRPVALSTLIRYEELARLHVLPVIGHLRAAQVEPRHLDRVYATVRQQRKRPTNAKAPRPDHELPLLSRSTVNRVHQLLHNLFGWAVRRRELPYNVAALVDPPGDAARVKVELEPTQIEAVLRAADDTRYGLFVRVGLATGCRFGELADLRWSQVSVRDETIRVVSQVRRVADQGLQSGEPKSTAGKRPIALPPGYGLRLAVWREEQDDERATYHERHRATDRVFTNTAGGPLESGEFRASVWLPLLERVGVPPLTFHAFTRHGHVSLLVRLGVDVETVRRRLGHADAAVTLRAYTHGVSGADREAAATIGSFLDALDDRGGTIGGTDEEEPEAKGA